MVRLLLSSLLLASFPVHAGEPPHVSAKISGSGIEVESSVDLPIVPCQAYAMLTDYDDLPKFIPGLVKSHAERISPDEVRVMQVGEVQAFLFRVEMSSTLDMTEFPGKRIVFRQVSGDFASYSGEWDFSSAKEGTEVRYRAKMTFRPYVPLAIAKWVLDSDVERKFVAIEREAESRKGAVCPES